MKVGLWAALFVACGEFPDMGTTYYHSAVNFFIFGGQMATRAETFLALSGCLALWLPSDPTQE